MTLVNGKYRVEGVIGTGSIAEVFYGSTVGAEGFARRVALKRMLPGFSNDPQLARLFVAEAQITSQLAHPNIVSVFDFDRDGDGQLFLAMELVEGRSLDAVLAMGPLPWDVTVYIVVELLRGLGYAHALTVGGVGGGLVHRDVSPANVLLSWHGAVKISDFGLAKVRGAVESSTSILLKGRPAYMSPEQVNGARLDGRSDLFSVGVVLWEMLVGRQLFMAADLRGTFEAVLYSTIPHPRQHRRDVPKELERIAMKLLEREVSQRYQTAGAVIDDLVTSTTELAPSRDRLVGVLGERFRSGSMAAPQPARAHELNAIASPRPAAQTRRRGIIALGLGAMTIGLAAYLGASADRTVVTTNEKTSSAAIAPSIDARSTLVTAPIDAAEVFAINFFVDPATVPHCLLFEKELARALGCGEMDFYMRDGMVNELATLRKDLAGHTAAILEPKSFDESCEGRIVDLYTLYPDCKVVPRRQSVDLHDVPPKCAGYMTQLEKLSACTPISPDNKLMFSTRLDQMLDRFTRIRRFTVPVARLFDALEAKCQQDHDGYLELQKTFGC